MDVDRAGFGILEGLRERLRGTGADAEKGGAGIRSLRAALTQAAGGAVSLGIGLGLIAWPAFTQGIGAAIGGLGALAAGAVAAVAALAPLAGLLPAIAAGALAGGQAFGVVALATAGLGGALKELTVDADKTAKRVDDSAARQEAAAERIANARRSLASAVRAEQRARERALERIAEAEDALADTTEDAAERQREAIARVREAEERWADASRSVERAREDVSDAIRESRREIDDLRTALARMALDEEDAILSVHEAWADLQDAFADPRADDLVRQRAELRYRQSVAALEDTRRRNEELRREEAAASAASVDGSERVRDARERLADAHRNEQRALGAVAEANRDAARTQRQSAEAIHDAVLAVAAAQRDAARDQEDATGRVTEAQLDLAAAMRAAERAAASMGDTTQSKLADLAPATQAFAHFLAGLKPLFDDLRQTAAAGLFPGVQAGIQAMLPLFPAFRNIVGATAGAIGGFAASLGQLVASPAFSSQLVAFGQANVGIIDQFGKVILALLPGVLAILTAVQPLVMWLGQLAAKWAENFSNAMLMAQANGTLAGFFERTRIVVEQLFAILGNLAGAFANVGKAAGPLGESLLTALVRASEAFERLTGSAEGQDAMRKFFDSLRPVLEALGGLFGDIALGFGKIMVEATPALVPVIDAVRDKLLPALVELFSKIDGEFLTSMVELAASFTRVLATFTGAGPVLVPIIDSLRGFLDIVRFLLTDVPFLSDFLRNLFAVAAGYGAIRGIVLIFKGLQVGMAAVAGLTSLPTFLGLVKIALGALLSPLGLVVAAVVGLAVLFVIHFDTIKRVAGDVAKWIGDRLGEIGRFLKRLVGAVIDFVKEWGILALGPVGVIIKFRDQIGDVLGKVIQFFIDLPGRIIRALGDLGKLLFNAGKDIVLGLIRGMANVVGEVKDFLTGLGRDIVRWKGPRDPVLLTGAGATIMDSLVKGFERGLPAVRKALSGTESLIAGSLGGIGAGIGVSALAGPLGGRSGVTVNGGASAAELESILARLLSGARPVTLNAYERENPMHFARRMLWEMG